MKKIALLVVIFLSQACNILDSNDEKTLLIQTEKTGYTVQNQFSTKIIFLNNLDRTVKIYHSSCGGLEASLHKYEDKEWILAGGQPICDRAAAPPIILNDGERVESNVNTAIYDNTLPGLFMLKFKITDNMDTALSEEYLISNQFELSRHK